MNYWERKEKLFRYVGSARQFFPLSKESLDAIARIIEKNEIKVDSYLDLGCGDGYMGYFIKELFPGAHGVFLDISEEMILKAKEKDIHDRFKFIVTDFSMDNWAESIKPWGKFDLVVSGFSIHHIENNKKRRLYNDIYQLLKPNGFFFNLEHVSSPTEKLEEIFTDLFDDARMEYHKHIHDEKTRDEIIELYHDPEHKKLNKLESVEKQCQWLREIGFQEVDCYMKAFELALFGGQKPPN